MYTLASHPLYARLAQLVERVIDVDDVGGSSPSPRTKDGNTSPAGGFLL